MGLCGSKEVCDGEVARIALRDALVERRGVIQFGEGDRRTRIVCLSDSHALHRTIDVPDGDVLLVAGDFLRWRETLNEAMDFNEWLGKLPHREKILVCGNHDLALQSLGTVERMQKVMSNCTLLHGTTCNIANGALKVYGAPWTLSRNCFYHANGFAISGRRLANEWDKVPDDADIILTHVPVYGVLDQYGDRRLGSVALRNRVANVKPRVCVFGHHHSPGAAVGDFEGTPSKSCLFVNAACSATAIDLCY